MRFLMGFNLHPLTLYLPSVELAELNYEIKSLIRRIVMPHRPSYLIPATGAQKELKEWVRKTLIPAFPRL
jgi:hypothetical protein